MDLQPQALHPHQELVKCVVVGDTAVGKTRLICARALDTKLQLNQLISTHIPTVWAIDQYRIHKQVLERSCEIVDGVNVSLRLWDTFGDHDKDRRFAYGRSDVVLLCFSIANPNSLRNCKTVWYPEIRRFCSNTPIILVGCKNDLRYMYNDEQYLNLCKEKSPFYRQLKESDILSPEACRKVAEELEVPYYECSVFTPFGIDTVFQNVIRVALLHRRQQRFWFNHLKSVQPPTLQDPYCPKKPPMPEIKLSESTCFEQMETLYEQMPLANVQLLTSDPIDCKPILAHQMLLSVASELFARLFYKISIVSSLNEDRDLQTSSDSSPVKLNLICPDCAQSDSESDCNSSNLSDQDEADRHLCFEFDEDLTKDNCSQTCSMTAGSRPRLRSTGEPILFKHPAIVSMKLLTADKESDNDCVCLKYSQVVYQVQLSDQISSKALQQCIRFIYTGTLNDLDVPFEQLVQTAQLLQLVDLTKLLQQTIKDQLNYKSIQTNFFYQKLLQELFRQQLQSTLDRLYQSALKHQFTDVTFQLDDGTVSCHKPILISRCEVFGAMFTRNFRESSLRVIRLPGVDCATFKQFVRFVYTDNLSNDSSDEFAEDLAIENWCRLIELADRLCLTRLLQLVEQRIAEQLKVMSDLDSLHQALKIVQRCQIHNAEQLADFCLYWVSVNYCDANNKLGRLLRSLHPENQAYLNMHRWPPVWYIKEREYYERCLRERTWSTRKSSSNAVHFNGVPSLDSNNSKRQLLRFRKRSICCLFFKRSKVTYTPLG